MMKRVVLVSDGRNFSKKTLNFLNYLYEMEPFLLIGAFFQSVNASLLIPNTFAPGNDAYVTLTKEEKQARERVTHFFKESCEKNKMDYRIHMQSDFWDVEEVIKESRFADLLVVNSECFFSDVAEAQPNHYLRDVFHYAECPVLVIPEAVQAIKRIAIAYDGKKESMFALKKFCDVLPALSKLPAEIFYWVENTDDEIPDLEYVQEFASRHFSNVSIREVFFDAGKYLHTWQENNPQTLFICGSFHRSKISTWLRKSFSEEIINVHSSPVFIAHS